MDNPNNNQPTDDQGNEMPPAPEGKPAGITIVFKDSHGGEVSFKLKPTTKLKKAMDAYAERGNLNVRALRFLFDGERVNEGSTAEGVSGSFLFSVLMALVCPGGGRQRCVVWCAELTVCVDGNRGWGRD